MRAKDSTDRGKQNSDAAAAAAAAEPSSTIPQQTKLSPSAILAQCLKLLKGQSDEHKFAGLVMVTKHVPALTVSDSVGSGEKAAGRGQLRQICDAVGPPFVHRLLRTAGDSSSSGSDGGLSMYQQIALGVLAAFLQDANLIARFLPVGPALVRAIRGADARTQEQALCDALACTQALAGADGGMERLLRAGAAAAVVNRLTASSRDRTANAAANANAKGEANAHTKVGAASDGVVESKSAEAGQGQEGASAPALVSPHSFGVVEGGEDRGVSGSGGETGAQALPARRAEILAFAFVGRALESSGGNCLGARELTAVAEAFRDDPTPAKFEFLDLVLRWAALQEGGGGSVALGSAQEALDADEGDSFGAAGDEGSGLARLGPWTKRGPFPAALREGLLQALHGAADDQRRDSALALLASLLRVMGQAWAVEESDEAVAAAAAVNGRGGGKKEKKNGSKQSRKRGTFVAFAVRCAAGEVRILLDETLSLLVPGAPTVPTAGTALPTAVDGGDEGNEAEFKVNARGPMGPAGVDPAIGLAAEIAAKAGAEEKKAGHHEGEPATTLRSRALLPAAERRRIKELRAARLLRMVPVGLGIAESTIEFLCGGGDGREEDEDFDERGGGATRRGRAVGGSGRWEELPIETLQDIQKTLMGLFGCVLDFLSEIRPWICPSVGESATKESGQASAMAPSIVDLWAMQRLGLECSRVLGVWVAEDPESLPQRFLEALPVLLALKAGDEPPDSDDEESDDEDLDDSETLSTPTLAAFPGAIDLNLPSKGLPFRSISEASAHPDVALHNISRAMLALSYEATPLAAMVEEGVTARLARLIAAGPPAITALIAIGAPAPPPEQLSEAVRSPLITACGLLTNILSSAGHLAWPEGKGTRRRPVAASSLSLVPPPPPSPEPSHPILAHPNMEECLVSLAEVAGVAGAARRAGGGTRWRLVAAHATLVVMIVARAATPGSGLGPKRDLAGRQARWGVGSGGDGKDALALAGTGGSSSLSVWDGMALAVNEALGSLSNTPGRGLVGGGRGAEEEEASYEEGAIWQWCLECAREIDVGAGGAHENSYVARGVLPAGVLMSLREASSDGRI